MFLGPVAQSAANPMTDHGLLSLIQPQFYNFMETDRAIFSMDVLHLPLIQEGLLSVTSESMSKSTG